MALIDSWEKMTQEEREDACSGNEDGIMVCPHCGYTNHFTEFVDPGNRDSGLAGCPDCCKDFEWVAELLFTSEHLKGINRRGTRDEL